MRIALPLAVIAAASVLAAGCHRSTAGDNVREAYDNRADAIDRQAQAQPTPVAQKIYHARADAIRDEGKDREKGIEGREPSHGPGNASVAAVEGKQDQ